MQNADITWIVLYFPGHSPEKEWRLPGKRSDRDSRQRLIGEHCTGQEVFAGEVRGHTL